VLHVAVTLNVNEACVFKQVRHVVLTQRVHVELEGAAVLELVMERARRRWSWAGPTSTPSPQ